MTTTTINYKNWCTENITPQSWARICLKSIDSVRAANISLKEIQEPSNDLELPSEVLAELNANLLELYDMKMEDKLIAN